MHSLRARRSRYALSGLFLAAFCLLPLLSRPASAGYASIVVDVGSGQVVHEVNADSLNYPASLTKLMTLYLTFGALKDGKLTLATMLPVSADAAAQQPTKLSLQEGDMVAVQDLILGVITHSANDAAYVLGEGIGGTEPAFADMMTKKARRLGMASTTFQNPNGLPDPDQMTTARDLSRLAIALYRDFPEYYGYFSVPSFTFHGTVYNNFDHLLRTFPGADGLKTGYTHASGYNLATSAERNGRRLVGIVMGTRSGGERDRLMIDLLTDAFSGRQTDDARVADVDAHSMEGRILARAIRAVENLNPIVAADAANLVRHARPPRLPHLTRGGDRQQVQAAADRAERALDQAGPPHRRGERWAVQIGAVSTRAARRAAESDVATPRAKPGRPDPAPTTVCRGRTCSDTPARAAASKATTPKPTKHVAS